MQDGKNNLQAASHGEPLALVLIYVIAAVFAFDVKEAVLTNAGGYRIVSRIAGQPEDALSVLSSLHFFSFDIVLLLGAVPLCLAWMSKFLTAKSHARFVLLISLGLIGLSFINLNALGVTGRFLSIDQVKPMLIWAQERPETIFEYVSVQAFSKLAIVLTIVVILYRYRNAALFSSFRPTKPIVIVASSASCVIAVYAWSADSLPRTKFHSSALVQMGQALFGNDRQAASSALLIHASEQLSYSCRPEATYSGTAAKAVKRNFVLFIMETVPYELFVQGKAGDLPAFEQLAKSGYRVANHYSTYPFTSYARFSIFTGLYPSYRLEKTLPLNGRHPYRSVFSSLVNEGYDFKVFDPVTKRYEIDDWVVHQLGGTVVSTEGSGGVEEKDERVLKKFLEQLKQTGATSTPFVYAYLPQITHGPWLPVGASKEMLYAEGLRRLRKLDSSLATIVETLKQNGMYENTVIVVTADHGLRTKKEAEFLQTDALNDVSYHVPMIIHDPRMKKTVEIRTLTSHLDISPTINCLYRNGASTIETQGRLISATDTSSRILYFGGAWYNGSDGLWDGHMFYSYNQELDMTWASKRFDFDDIAPVTDLHVVQRVSNVLQSQGNFQEALLSRY